MDFLVQLFDYFKGGPPKAEKNKEYYLQKRKDYLAAKHEIFFRDDPLLVSRAFMQYVYDEKGKRFLDCISNVQHVGHCHPTVVADISRQLAVSTCNLRFISPALTDCAEAILKTLPGLDTILFCNSGSEANDLALRLAKDFTRQTDVIVMDHAYHGHLTSAMQISPYMFDHGSSLPKPKWVHVAPTPDVFRGSFRLSDEDLQNKEKLQEVGEHYANAVGKIVEDIESSGRTVAAYIAEALQACGGQVMPPSGYFRKVAEHVRKHGGVVILDEVQTGFGRVGSKFWAYQQLEEGFVPDILTMGKPMGNGYPVSAVVTRKEIADALGGECEYFNTYGGNPVACTAVLSLMKVIREENLLSHSQKMGEAFDRKFRELMKKHDCIGDVRGVGLFYGVDFVKDRKTREPHTELAQALIFKLRKDHGILMNSDGPHRNILKIKPPLCFNKENLNEAVEAVDRCLTELGY